MKKENNQKSELLKNGNLSTTNLLLIDIHS